MNDERLTQAVLGDQPLTEDERELVETIYSRIETFEQRCREYHVQARTAREILRLRDPYQDDDPRAKKKTLQLQTLKSTINNTVADQMENVPEARILPETPDKQTLADDMQDIVHHIIYDVNNFMAIQRRRAEDFYCVGTSFIQTAWDETMLNGKGEIAIIRYPIEAMLWDTDAEDIQDCRAVIKCSWHPLSWFKAHYPDKYMYVNAEENQYNDVGMPDSQKYIDTASDEPRAMLAEYWYREFDAKTKRYSINVAYVAGGALLESQKNVYWHGLYPFVVDVHDRIEGSLAGDGLVMELAPMMRYINRYARYIDMNLRMSSKGRLLVRRNCGIDTKALADWDKDMIEGDSIVQGEDWGWLQHVPFNGMISNQMLQFQADLKQDAGANQFTRGETTGGIVSGKAIGALQEAGGKIARMRTDDLNSGFKQMVEQILWLAAQFWTEERVFMITGRDGKARAVSVDPRMLFGTKKKGSSIYPPPYTVQIEIQTKNQARIDAMNQTYMDAYTMAAQAQQYFPLSALFQLMNIDGKDRLMPIIEQNEQTQQQMTQLQEQNQQLVEQMAQMQKENDSLRRTSTQVTNALASIKAGNGGGFVPQGSPVKAAQSGGGATTQSAIVNQARSNMAKEVVPNYEE